MQVTSTVIITTKTAASIAKKMERPIARPTEVDAVAVVEGGSVLNVVCVCVCVAVCVAVCVWGGNRCERILESIHSKF